MTELSFTKQFLATLATRNVHIPADFCEDPRKLPSRTPYTLPPTKKPKTKRTTSSTTTSIPSANISIKSLRGAQISHEIPSTPLSSTILTLKHNLSKATGLPIDKLKLLLKGKVLTDLKTLEELGIVDGVDVGFTVMVMGGASPAPSAPPEDKGLVDPGEDKGAVKKSALGEEKFWQDLGAFLKERLGSSEVLEEPEHVLETFRVAWGKRTL
ncbi:uncharacterized protein LAJ45_04504 [Morchella importuna]|uniref:Ubiquitin-like domain-containing protein n=1 Tax=Morchella conica CCBAS932 TaxID=1392247 RepID=A0A3N4KXZ1_9PEZI|nr:uncharacterized protein LAJ45_04504 [Morchella importuna]KAH8151302.1 hypothetical protein LAJ45_04504 [Morchella importuna]RPB14338.1 hypothetical protein P167DRAFT_604181 [Morchella conica CCBAS932]